MSSFRISSLLFLVGAAVGTPQQANGYVRSGIVPIFDSRVTDQPITFTFTTPSPAQKSATEYPIQSVQNAKFPTLRPGSADSVPDIEINYPIYNQAQYFRAIQQAKLAAASSTPPPPPTTVTSAPEDEWSAFWSRVTAAWALMRRRLTESGAENDWRRLWEKFTGAFEPFLSQVGASVGRAANSVIRQQQMRMHRYQSRFYSPLESSQQDAINITMF